MYIRQVVENPEDLKKPNDNENHHHDIENGFNLVVHGNVSIDKP
jgi:hypothetical protein